MYRQHYPDDPGLHNMPEYPRPHVTYRRNPTFVERVRQNCVGAVAGLALILGGVCLIFWNEGRAVQTAKSLDEGMRLVMPLQSSDVIFEENNGRLVHLSGPLRTGKVLYDEYYGVAVQAVKMKRDVKMYQWVEHEHKRDIDEEGQTRTETTYTYSKEWRSELMRSDSFANRFSHENPDSKPVESKVMEAEDAQVGIFYLTPGLLSKISNFKQLETLPAPKDPKIQLHFGAYYHGQNPLQPEIGDLKVMFEYAGLSGRDDSNQRPPDVVSIIAKQRFSELTAYQTEAGDELQLLYMGELTPQQIFGQEQAQNTMMTWGLRFVGWLLMFVGYGCLTQIILTLVDWIPLVRDLVALGVLTLNLTLSICLSLTVIAMGWIFYRPWLGCSILVCATIPFILARLRTRRRMSREL